jgi:aspartyl-tRNA(Asn)/glutamyl-tRNA(Gln) amidotransferase subunit C
MKITREEVARVALLARLRLTPAEEEAITGQLDQILGYMDRLAAVDTSNVPPFSQAADAANELRDDRITNRPDAEALLANAPDRDGTFFKVPKILE